MPKLSKILVTGCSGFIGMSLVRRLNADNLYTIGLDLVSPKPGHEPDEFHRVDMLDASRLGEVLRDSGAQAVVHLAATHDLSDPQNEKMGLAAYRTNIAGTENLLTALAMNPDIRRVIFTSSQLVSRIGHQVESLENAKPDTFYGKSKLIGEQTIHSWQHKPYVWTIVRPTTVWGPGMMPHYRRFIRFIEQGWYFHVSSKPMFKSYGYIDNIVHQYIAILNAADDAVADKTFYLADYEPLSIRQYADEIGKNLNARPIISLPLALCHLLAFLGDGLAMAGFARFPFTSFRLRNILAEYVYDVSETERLCGPLPVAFKDAVKRTVAWYKTGQVRQDGN